MAGHPSQPKKQRGTDRLQPTLPPFRGECEKAKKGEIY